MELLQLKYFLDVAQTQHMTHSAQRLHVAQPAVTQAIHRLEKEMGVPLFTRKGRGIRLNEYGRYLSERLAPLMDTLDGLPGELAAMADLENATIRINVLAASTLVADAVARYAPAAEHLNFKMTQSPESPPCDMEITTRLFYQPRDTEREYVCTEQIFMAVPARGRYADRSALRLADLNDEGFISLQGSSQLRLITDSFCRRAGFRPHVIFESDNSDAVRNMISANMGIGFWPEFTWGHILTDRVRLLPIEDIPCQRDILLTRREENEKPEVTRFFRYLAGCFERRQSEARNALG